MVLKIKNHTDLQKALIALSEILQGAGASDEKIFDCKLVACELVGNVLRHTNGSSGLTAKVETGRLEMKILSESYFELPKEIVCSDEFCEHGRGLFLVKELCEEITSLADGILVKLRIR